MILCWNSWAYSNIFKHPLEWSDDELKEGMHEREAENAIEPEAEHDQEDDQLVDVSTWCQYDFYSVIPIVKKMLMLYAG